MNDNDEPATLDEVIESLIKLRDEHGGSTPVLVYDDWASFEFGVAVFENEPYVGRYGDDDRKEQPPSVVIYSDQSSRNATDDDEH